MYAYVYINSKTCIQLLIKKIFHYIIQRMSIIVTRVTWLHIFGLTSFNFNELFASGNNNFRWEIFWDICAPTVHFLTLILWKLQVLYYTLNSSGDPGSKSEVLLLFHCTLNMSCNSTYKVKWSSVRHTWGTQLEISSSGMIRRAYCNICTAERT